MIYHNTARPLIFISNVPFVYYAVRFPVQWQCMHWNVFTPNQFSCKKYVFLGWDIIHLQLWKHDCDLRADLTVRQDRDTDGHGRLLQDVCYRTVAVESCNRQRPDNKPITFTWPPGSLAGLYYSWLVWCTVKNAVTWLREVGGRDKTIKRPVSV